VATLRPSFIALSAAALLAVANVARPDAGAGLSTTEGDFYQQRPSYWEQVVHNLGGWIGIPLTALDAVILVPFLPLLTMPIVLFTLPWGRKVWTDWLREDAPKAVYGAYVLYASFTLWHFHAPSWLVVLVGIVGVWLCATALHDRFKPWRNPDL
jgi:hypothetical protein